MRFAIIGAGALGTFYASRLYAAGHEVHLLARSDAAIGRAQGFHCRSPLGAVTIPGCFIYADVHDLPPCQVVIVALKTVDNHQLPQLLPPALAADGHVLVLQNGLGVEDEAAAVVGPERVWGGLCFLCANKVAPAVVKHSAYGKVAFGRHSADGKARPVHQPLRQVAEAFGAGGIECELDDDLLAARWRKLCWNIPYNGLCTLLDCNTAELTTQQPIRQLVAELMAEVQQGAASCGRLIDDEFLAQMVNNTDRMGPYLPSMLLDRRAGRALECRHLFDHPLQAAAAHGCQLPRIQTLAQALHFINDRASAPTSAD